MAPTKKEESQSSNCTQKTNDQRGVIVQEQPMLKCPRCDSMNTKFCYFNNYSLTQPRHFCKTCRRYWTKGGALRNVPIGGACRKNKKVKPSSSTSSSTTSSDINGFKFFHGVSPTMDFQLTGYNLPRLHHSNGTPYNHPHQFSSFMDVSSMDPSGFNFSTPSFVKQGENNNNNNNQGFNGDQVQEMANNNLASSMESLSSINQELHWKLQQQRFGMLFNAENQKENRVLVSSSSMPHLQIKPQPILFENLEISRPNHYPVAADNSRKEGNNGNLATEWFFGNSYAPVNNQASTSNGNGVQSWSNMNQFTALP